MWEFHPPAFFPYSSYFDFFLYFFYILSLEGSLYQKSHTLAAGR